jgi:hypothetical protein
MKELLVLLEDQLHARGVNLHILTGICAGILFAQTRRIMEINNLSTITREVIETARESLVIDSVGDLEAPVGLEEAGVLRRRIGA